MRKSWIVAITLLAVNLLAGVVTTTAAQDAAVVAVAQGQLQGTIKDGVLALKGVPFAAPPTGALRFMPPQPPANWEGVRDATADAAWCIQPDSPLNGGGKVKRSEDCLYLNIWAPAEPGPHPVFFWVHGGANTGSSPSDPIFDGSSFARNGVVVVDIAYRLGISGFLELGGQLGPEYRGSANNALKDVAAGLHWVHANIAAVGGDPAKITIAGESAGGRNVTSLLGAPSAQGLFQSAIIESGGEVIFSVAEADAVAEIAVSAIRQNGGSAKDLLNMSTDGIIGLQEVIDKRFERRSPYRAMVGGDFLPDAPLAAIEKGGTKSVRLLIGTNRDEMAIFTSPEVAETPLAQTEMANLHLSDAERIYRRYAEVYPDLSPYALRVRFLSAQEYWVSCMRIAQKHAGASGAGTTWVYRFDREATSKLFAGLVPHASELPYIWNNIDDPVYTNVFGVKDETDRKIADEMHGRWISFIKGNSPDIPGSTVWPIFDNNGQILIFDAATKIGELDKVEFAIWQ